MKTSWQLFKILIRFHISIRLVMLLHYFLPRDLLNNETKSYMKAILVRLKDYSKTLIQDIK